MAPVAIAPPVVRNVTCPPIGPWLEIAPVVRLPGADRLIAPPMVFMSPVVMEPLLLLRVIGPPSLPVVRKEPVVMLEPAERSIAPPWVSSRPIEIASPA